MREFNIGVYGEHNWYSFPIMMNAHNDECSFPTSCGDFSLSLIFVTFRTRLIKHKIKLKREMNANVSGFLGVGFLGRDSIPAKRAYQPQILRRYTFTAMCTY